MNTTLRGKNKLNKSKTKSNLKANRSMMNFKSKKGLKKIRDEEEDDSDEENEESESEIILKNGKKLKKNKKNKNVRKKRDISNNKNNKRRAQSVKSSKPKIKNKFLKTNRSEIKKNRFNRTIQSEKKSIGKKFKNFGIKKRSSSPNSTLYRNRGKNGNKPSRPMTIDGSRKYNNKMKRSSFDQTNQKYRLNSGLNGKNKNNFWLSHNYRRDSEDGIKSSNFLASKYTNNTFNYFKSGSRRFNFLNNLLKEKEDGFYNRITLFPNIEENNNFHERKYLREDLNNPYSVKWPSKFLEIGYSSGFYYDDYQDGVPLLRLRKIKNKVILPPINSRYSVNSEKAIDIPQLNFHNLTRQERINYILSTEANMNNENNVFKSIEARKRLLEKFNNIDNGKK